MYSKCTLLIGVLNLCSGKICSDSHTVSKFCTRYQHPNLLLNCSETKYTPDVYASWTVCLSLHLCTVIVLWESTDGLKTFRAIQFKKVPSRWCAFFFKWFIPVNYTKLKPCEYKLKTLLIFIFREVSPPRPPNKITFIRLWVVAKIINRSHLYEFE